MGFYFNSWRCLINCLVFYINFELFVYFCNFVIIRVDLGFVDLSNWVKYYI